MPSVETHSNSFQYAQSVNKQKKKLHQLKNIFVHLIQISRKPKQPKKSEQLNPSKAHLSYVKKSDYNERPSI